MNEAISPFFVEKYKHLSEYLKEKNSMISGTGLMTRTDIDGFITTLTKNVFDGRKKAKNEMLELKKNKGDPNTIAALDMKQSSFKVLGNSLYGITSLPYFKYYYNDIAATITYSGQSYLKIMINHVNDMLNKFCGTNNVDYAFYGDTDSIYFTCDAIIEKFCKGKEKHEIIKFLEKLVKNVIQVEMNKKLDNIAKKLNVHENKMFFKLEGISDSAIWLAKKRYVANILYNEGVWYDPPDMKVMGMEIVRSSTPKYIKEQLRKAVKICITGTEDELQDYVKSCKVDFMKRSVEEIAFPRGCNGLITYADEKTIYKPGTQAHIRAALLHNHMLKEKKLDGHVRPIEDGERIKFVWLKKPNPMKDDVIAYVGKLPHEFGLHQYISKDVMFEKGFISPIEGVLQAIGWSWERETKLDF